MAKKKTPEPKGKQVHAPGEPVYTVMAFVTFVALAVGCVLLYLDFDEYGGKTAPAEKVPALQQLGGANAAPAPSGN
ncbi:MAG: hypothetical protein U0791_02275 [Gemmataceae bacterium]